MVHHYLEDHETPDETHPPPVKFNARIEPPYSAPPETARPASPVTPVKEAPIPVSEALPSCCPTTPPIPLILHRDPLVEALPTVLVGVGVAWMIGVATGAWIFSSPVE